MKFGVLYGFRNPPKWQQPYPDFYRAQEVMPHLRPLKTPAKAA
jgi:hypothetical protein